LNSPLLLTLYLGLIESARIFLLKIKQVIKIIIGTS